MDLGLFEGLDPRWLEFVLLGILELFLIDNPKCFVPLLHPLEKLLLTRRLVEVLPPATPGLMLTKATTNKAKHKHLSLEELVPQIVDVGMRRAAS